MKNIELEVSAIDSANDLDPKGEPYRAAIKIHLGERFGGRHVGAKLTRAVALEVIDSLLIAIGDKKKEG